MIPPHAHIVLATQPVDFRKGPDGLAALVRDAGADPFSGALYVFRAKRADRVKIVWWDGTGLCLFAKRLETDRFHWPKLAKGSVRMSAAQLAALVEGMDWMRVRSAPLVQPTSAG
jgi:transposase